MSQQIIGIACYLLFTGLIIAIGAISYPKEGLRKSLKELMNEFRGFKMRQWFTFMGIIMMFLGLMLIIIGTS